MSEYLWGERKTVSQPEDRTVWDYQVECYANARNKGFYEKHEKMLDLLGSRTEDGDDGLIEHYMVIWRLARLMLIVTEVSEAAEGVRKNDDRNLSEEMADIFIRLADSSGDFDIDLDLEVSRKMAVNADREYMHGKQA